MKNKKRCQWAGSDPLYQEYHDREWGVPVHDDQVLFEMLNLEGAQAGLSWITVLRKRENYRKAFDGFDPKKILKYDAKKRAALMKDPGIIRNRLKIAAVVSNAAAYLEVKKEFGSLDRYLWGFVGGKPIIRNKKGDNFRVSSPESFAMSKALKKRGFKFVGETICYAFMQAVGMVNDHSSECFKFKSR